MSLSLRVADASTIRLFDSAVLAWMVLWLAVGTWSGYTVWQLSELGDTVTSSGEAIGKAGEALSVVGDLPLVGESPGELGAEAEATGEEISVRGQEVKGQLRQLAVLLGLSITLIPVTPVVGLYVPLRLARRREVRALARALSRHPDDEALDRLLAERALTTLPYDVVGPLLGTERHLLSAHGRRELADAELARLRLSRHA
jgi:hypothetical protein